MPTVMTVVFRRRCTARLLLVVAVLAFPYFVYTLWLQTISGEIQGRSLSRSFLTQSERQLRLWQTKEDDNDDANIEMHTGLGSGISEGAMRDRNRDPYEREDEEDDGFIGRDGETGAGTARVKKEEGTRTTDTDTHLEDAEDSGTSDDTTDEKSNTVSEPQKAGDQALASSDSQALLPTTTHQSHLLILAYMRTGSSMTGRILQSSPKVFYWFEPLNSLERYYVTERHPELPRRNRTMIQIFKATAMAGGNVSAALSCDILNVYNGTLLHSFMRYGRYGTKYFHSCFTGAKTAERWRQCAVNMTNVCRQKYKATAVKTIRLTMTRALEAMRKDPKMRVVHLVRDPRAVLLSRHRLGYANFSNLQLEASLQCQRFWEDLDNAPAPGDPLKARYMLVRYEDIAAVPLNHTYHLYRFMGLQPSPEVVEKIRSMMATAKKTKRCPTCPSTPLNSTEVAQAWRQTLTFDQVRIISKECADVLRRLGYRESFENEEQLRGLSMSAVGPIPVVHS